jgi:hypothetical protein
MKITIDNLNGVGPVDYTGWLDGTVAPRIARTINAPAVLLVSLVESAAAFVAPVVHGW